MSDGPLPSQEQHTSGWHLSGDMAALLRITAGVCSFSHAVQFFPCGWVPNNFENMVASNTAVDLKNQFRQTNVRLHAKSATITSQRKSEYIISSYKSPSLNFTNIKIQPFFTISPNLMLAKFSRYTVCSTPLLLGQAI